MDRYVFVTDTANIIALAAILVSACVAVPTVLSIRQQRPESAMSGLLRRIAECETQIRDLKDDLRECSKQREALESENLRLMRELFRAKNGGA